MLQGKVLESHMQVLESHMQIPQATFAWYTHACKATIVINFWQRK